MSTLEDLPQSSPCKWLFKYLISKIYKTVYVYEARFVQYSNIRQSFKNEAVAHIEYCC